MAIRKLTPLKMHVGTERGAKISGLHYTYAAN